MTTTGPALGLVRWYLEAAPLRMVAPAGVAWRPRPREGRLVAIASTWYEWLGGIAAVLGALAIGIACIAFLVAIYLDDHR